MVCAMRCARLTRWLVAACLALTACSEPRLSKQATPPADAAPTREPTTEAQRATGAAPTADAMPDTELRFLADATPSADLTPTELLVATGSRGCTTKQCPGQCCNECGRVVWKLVSDPDARVVARGVALPKLAATECALHYDLRAEGQKERDRFVVRAVRPVPSERGRRPGTPGQLELRAQGGVCTAMACEPSVRCCNRCAGVSWAPKPTLDAITWSGPVLLPTSAMDCEGFPDRMVTGTWLGPDAFEIASVRRSRHRF
jgi:hypothetical protein